MSYKPALAALLAATVVVQAAPAAHAGDRVHGPALRVGVGAGASQVVTLPRGTSMNVDLPADVRDVLVSNPKVADVVHRTPRRLSVLGVGPGRTDAVFFDEAGRPMLTLDIRVGQDSGVVAETINRLVPGAKVEAESLNESIVLTGQVANAGDAEKAVRVAERYVTDPKLVLNMIQVAGQEQVMLKIRIIEVQRSIVKQLGVSLDALIDQASDTPIVFRNRGLSNTPGQFRITNTSGDDSLSAALSAYERVGMVRVLAEPNLTAVSGEGAVFLAGGEFPIPSGVDQNGNIIITYKPYGVRLSFTPLVLSEGQIFIKLSTEVSDLSNQGALQIDGLSLLGVTARRTETSVELPSGGALMISGLLHSRSRQSIDALPGLTGLPVLGALFRSRDFLNDETELVVIATPYLVKPVAPGQLQTPADGMEWASDLDTILLGRLHRPSAPGAPAAAPPPGYRGPFGYVID